MRHVFLGLLSSNNLFLGMSDDEILNRASYYELLSLYINRNTPLAARLSCGGTIDAALAVSQGGCQRALAIVRPPGHHAEPREFMGFCFYNNVAVATKVVQTRTPTRVLILDWWVVESFAVPCESDSFLVGMFTTVGLIAGRRSRVDFCQGMASTLRLRTTQLCFTSQSTGTRAGPSIPGVSSVVLSHVEKAQDWDCMYPKYETRRD